MDGFSDEFITNTHASALLDSEDEDRRLARMLATITNAINNALRLNGRDVPKECFRTEESFMPSRKRAKQIKSTPTWSGVVKGLGFGQ